MWYNLNPFHFDENSFAQFLIKLITRRSFAINCWMFTTRNRLFKWKCFCIAYSPVFRVWDESSVSTETTMQLSHNPKPIQILMVYGLAMVIRSVHTGQNGFRAIRSKHELGCVCVCQSAASNVIVYINILLGRELNQISGKEHSTHIAGHIHTMSHCIIHLVVR